MDKRIAFLRKQMLANLRHTLTIEQMARVINLSESHLLWLFKREVGMSPIQYLNHLRLETAKDLLENTFLQVKQVGDKVGMSDQSHFIHDFKEKYGTTPSQYRKQHWAKTEAEESKANES